MKVLFLLFTVNVVNSIFASNEYNFSNNNLNDSNECVLVKRNSEKRDYVPDSCSSDDDCQANGIFCDKRLSQYIQNRKKTKIREDLSQAVNDLNFSAFSEHNNKTYCRSFSEAVSDFDSWKEMKKVFSLLNARDEMGITIGDALINMCKRLKSRDHNLLEMTVFNTDELKNFKSKINEVGNFSQVYFYDALSCLVLDNIADIKILDNSLIILSKINEAVFYFYQGNFFYVSENNENPYQLYIVNKLQNFSAGDLAKLKVNNSGHQKIEGLIFVSLYSLLNQNEDYFHKILV